jgi:tetratricopeptide (TPR) repeat protein
MGKLSQEIWVMNEADQLRNLIDDCEKALASLNPESTQLLLTYTEKAHRLLEKLQAVGADLRGEAARLGSVDDRILKDARKIVRILGGTEVLVSFRNQIAPGTTESWWMLDRVLELARRSLIRKMATFAIIVAIILIAGYIARPVLFPPDPVGDAVSAASNSLGKQDIPGAMATINTALTKLPTNTELLIWKGILLQSTGDLQASDSSFTQALKYAASEQDFYLQRAITYVRLGESDRVISDTNVIIQKYPTSAEAYYIRATGYEALGKRVEAIADLQKCGDLAQAAGNDALFAQARVRLGTLLQGGQ